MKNSAVIAASGTGSRTGLDIPKQFYKIKNKTVLEYSIEIFENHNLIDAVIIVSHPDFIKETQKIAEKYSKVIKIVPGGSTRQQSVYSGLKAIENEHPFNVLIHDAARPFTPIEVIDRCLNALEIYEAVNTAIECTDTIIRIDNKNIIQNVPDRSTLRRCQTPQGFRYELIKKAHELARAENYLSAPDDCSLILKYNLADVYAAEGSEKNIKITYFSDIKPD